MVKVGTEKACSMGMVDSKWLFVVNKCFTTCKQYFQMVLKIILNVHIWLQYSSNTHTSNFTKSCCIEILVYL